MRLLITLLTVILCITSCSPTASGQGLPNFNGGGASITPNSVTITDSNGSCTLQNASGPVATVSCGLNVTPANSCIKIGSGPEQLCEVGGNALVLTPGVGGVSTAGTFTAGNVVNSLACSSTARFSVDCSGGGAVTVPTVTANTLQSPGGFALALDTGSTSGATLNIGTTNATQINVGRSGQTVTFLAPTVALPTNPSINYTGTAALQNSITWAGTGQSGGNFNFQSTGTFLGHPFFSFPLNVSLKLVGSNNSASGPAITFNAENAVTSGDAYQFFKDNGTTKIDAIQFDGTLKYAGVANASLQTCNAGQAGAQQYDTTNNVMAVCNGTRWTYDFWTTCAGGGGTSCTATVPSGTVCICEAQSGAVAPNSCAVASTTATCTFAAASSATWNIRAH